MSDAEPAEIARPTTPDVVATLVANHRDFLAFVQRRVGDRALAEEILQDAFVRAMERGDSLREGELATAWFYRLLRNAIVDHHRRRGAEARAAERAAAEPGEPAPTPDDELATAVCACMHTLLDTLEPSHADILRHVDLADESVPDYAARTGITKNNAGVRLHRARNALLARLVTSCGTCATHGCLDCHCGAPGARAHAHAD
jgi:RNA polymerase sigma-70 factor (ECF subfamily)